VVEFLVANGGFDPSLGARPMRGTVQRLLEAPLAERILAGEFGSGDVVAVTAAEATLRFTRTA
jgi:ATP-dependent Clp protease ATP-binding subunit ClpC